MTVNEWLIPMERTCERCDGTGRKDKDRAGAATPGDADACPVCQASGVERRRVSFAEAAEQANPNQGRQDQ